MYSSSTTVSGNKVTGSGWGGIFILDSSPSTTISGNTVTGNGREGGIFISNSPSTTISGNTVTGNGKEGGISISTSPSTTISGNTVTGNENAGISISTSPSTTISGNIVENNFVRPYLNSHISVYKSTLTLTNNRIKGSVDNDYVGNGILLDGSSVLLPEKFAGNTFSCLDNVIRINIRPDQFGSINKFSTSYPQDWSKNIFEECK